LHAAEGSVDFAARRNVVRRWRRLRGGGVKKVKRKEMETVNALWGELDENFQRVTFTNI
jgi:hypothetical protein